MSTPRTAATTLIPALWALALLEAPPVTAQIIHSDHVDITGNLCAGSAGCTGTPADDLVVNDPTPALRLDDTSPKATDYDLRTLGTDFIVQSIPSAGSLSTPFRIESGAPSNSLVLTATGDIGLGTAIPGQELHIASNTPSIRFDDTDGNQVWDLHGNSNAFSVTDETAAGSGKLLIKSGFPLLVGIGTLTPQDTLHVQGGLTVSGTVRLGSSRTVKKNITPVDGAGLLGRVRRLPISTWQYKEDANEARHVGPMAEDFHEAFGLGRDAQHIAPSDLAGVALAAIQALTDQVKTLTDRLAALEAENRDLRQRVAALATR